MRDFYECLGIKRGASAKEIKSAYRKLARQNHPDVNPGDKQAEERFKEISAAYDVLSDPEQRKKYDRVGHEAWMSGFKDAPPGARPGAQWGFPGAGGSPFHSQSYSTSPGGGFGGEVDMEDLLGGLFGGGGRRRRPQRGPLKGEDSVARLSIPMVDSISGGEKQISISSASGGIESLTVKIPAGIREGQKIRLAKKGNPGFMGGPPGDLLIEILFEPDSKFTRNGDDLTSEVEVLFSTAALGGKVDVTTLTGSVELSIPAGTQGGQRFRLSGKGLAKKGNRRGDLFAKVKILVPKELDDEGRELLEQLKKYE